MTVFNADIAGLAQWYGSNREKPDMPGRLAKQLVGRAVWVGVCFMGAGPELPYFDARAGTANDLHRHIINMARVIRDPALKEKLAERLTSTLFHPDELAACQRRCQEREKAEYSNKPGGSMLFGEGAILPPQDADLDWAYDYFVCTWMGRGANSGIDGEFDGGLSYRWKQSGGDSNTRFRSAIRSLDEWMKALERWNFTTIDAFEFLDLCHDAPGYVIYCDPPWPFAGDSYKHKFDEPMQRRLEARLRRFRHAQVIVRYGDHPLIRDLYRPPHWTWREHETRDQHNQTVREVLIINTPEAA